MTVAIISPAVSRVVAAYIEAVNAPTDALTDRAAKRRDTLARKLTARDRDILAVMGGALQRMADA